MMNTDTGCKTNDRASEVLAELGRLVSEGKLPPLPAKWACDAHDAHGADIAALMGVTPVQAMAIKNGEYYGRYYEGSGWGNDNLNLEPCAPVLFDALKAWDGSLKGYRISTDGEYVGFYFWEPGISDDRDMMYDSRPGRLMTNGEWIKDCARWHREAEEERLSALEGKGLRKAWESALAWLKGHRGIPVVSSDGANSGTGRCEYAVIERSLGYGWRIKGLCVPHEGPLAWEVQLFDRSAESGDVLRGMDDAYLAWDGCRAYPAVLRYEYGGDGTLLSERFVEVTEAVPAEELLFSHRGADGREQENG